MKNCIHCSSSRVANVSAKCSDTFGISIGNDIDHSGYVLEDVGLGDNEDYVRFSFCLNCGRMQNGKFPLPLTQIEKNAEKAKFNVEGELPTEVDDCVEFELENEEGEKGLYVGFVRKICENNEMEVEVDGFYDPKKGDVDSRSEWNWVETLPTNKLRLTDKSW
jgi:hypothetical protein